MKDAYQWFNRNTYFVIIFLHETPKCQTKSFVWSNTPVHAIHCPWCFILVDFLAFAWRRQTTPSGQRHCLAYCNKIEANQ